MGLRVYLYARIAKSRKHTESVIRTAVIYQDDLQILCRLVQQAIDTVPEEGFGIIYGYDNTDHTARCV